MNKVCKDCGESKPVEDFFPDNRYRDGYMNYCRACRNKRAKQYRKNNPDYNKKRRLLYAKKHKEQVLLNNLDSILGGYKIYILKHIKNGECRFNIVPTKGEIFRTNTFTDLIDYLYKINKTFTK